MNSSRFRRRARAPLALAVALCGLGAGSLRAQTITEFPLPIGTKVPGCIVPGAGGDDHLWSADRGTNASESGIARVTTSGDIAVFPVQGMTVGGGLILRLMCAAPGPDGNVWFTLTETSLGQIGRIAPDGTVTLFSTLIQSRLDGLAAGPDGSLWFTQGSAGKIGRITAQGAITNSYSLPTAEDYPQAIALGPGPDADLWFTERDGGRIGRITTSGVLTEYPIPTAASSPQGITLGPDGALWFTETHANKIGRITTSGSITEFTIPTPNAGPQVITNGPDGALWFTENAANKLGRITPGGSITELSVPTAHSQPFGITSGPDGNIWFTESAGNKIGRVELPETCGTGRGHVRPVEPVSGLPCVGKRS